MFVMENDNSALDILKLFAKSTQRQIITSEKQYAVKGIYARPFHVQYAIITSRTEPKIYFVNYSDSKKYGLNAMYSGFFFEINAPKESSIIIRKKSILDKLNPFSKKNIFSRKFHEFSSKVVAEGTDVDLATKIFDNMDIQDLTIKTLNLDQRIMLGLNNIEIDIIPELKNKSVFGFFIAEQWLLDNHKNSEFFKIIVEFRKNLSA